MASTYQIITKQTLSSTQSSITLSSIPQTYSDLELWFCADGGGYNGTAITMRPNNTSTSVYSYCYHMKDGSSTTPYFSSQSSQSSGYLGEISGTNSTAGAFGVIKCYIPDYAKTQRKGWTSYFSSQSNTADVFLGQVSGVCTDTTAISSLVILGTNMIANSTIYLYGIKNS